MQSSYTCSETQSTNEIAKLLLKNTYWWNSGDQAAFVEGMDRQHSKGSLFQANWNRNLACNSVTGTKTQTTFRDIIKYIDKQIYGSHAGRWD